MLYKLSHMCTVIKLYLFFFLTEVCLLNICRGNCIQHHIDGDDSLSATLSIHFMFITVMLGAEIQIVHLCLSALKGHGGIPENEL